MRDSHWQGKNGVAWDMLKVLQRPVTVFKSFLMTRLGKDERFVPVKTQNTNTQGIRELFRGEEEEEKVYSSVKCTKFMNHSFSTVQINTSLEAFI